LELFKSGDMTQVSDKGSNSSGGQKTRITIARAVYSDSDIPYLSLILFQHFICGFI